MIQAASAGLIDFSQARFYDRFWERRLQYMIDGLSRQNQRERDTLLFHHSIALLTWSRLDRSKIDGLNKSVAELYDAILETYYPGAGENQETREKQRVKEDVSAWEQQFGNLNNEETRKQVEAFAEAMHEQRRQTAKSQREAAQGSMGYLARELGINPDNRRGV